MPPVFSLLALFYFVCVFFIAMIIVYFSVLRAYAPEGEAGWHSPVRQRRRKMPLQPVVVIGHKVTVVRNVGSRTPQGMFYSPRTRNIACTFKAGDGCHEPLLRKREGV